MTNEVTPRFRQDIQGLRAIAVLLVVVYHTDRSLLTGGYVGVDVFFAISGYLITSHLMDGLEKDGRISFARFYARRARRILPASFVVLLLTFVASYIWLPPLQLESITQAAIATALYLPNVYFAVKGTDYLAETAPSVFQQYWSLGVEEQFYLIWPALISIAFVVVRRSQRGLLLVLVVTLAASFLLNVLVMTRSQPWAFFSLPTRAWELGVGGLLAILLRKRQLAQNLSLAAGWLGLVAILGSAVLMSDATPYPGYWAAVPVLGCVAVIAGREHGRSVAAARVLSARPFQFIGNISYSMYLVHWPLIVIPVAVAGSIRPLPLWQVALLGLASIPAGYLSYRFVEAPLRRPRGVERPRRILIVTGACSLLIVGISLAGEASTGVAAMNAGRSAPISDVTINPEGTPFVPTNLQPNLRAAAGDNALIYSTGCMVGVRSMDVGGCTFGSNLDAPRVALFGDSHAAQWFPAILPLAESGQILLEVHTKQGCASAFTDIEAQSGSGGTCRPWREAVIEQIRASPPAAVILASFAFNNALTAPEPGVFWQGALQATVDALNIESPIAIFADTPNMPDTPAICLSAHLDDVAACTWPAAQVFRPALRTAEQQVAGAKWIDFSGLICNSQTCPPIIGNSLVYRDANHLTATFSRTLAPVVGPRVMALLASG